MLQFYRNENVLLLSDEKGSFLSKIFKKKKKQPKVVNEVSFFQLVKFKKFK